jgi:hypothetical protein
MKTDDRVGEAIRATLISPNECDSNMEPANIVDGLFAIARALNRVAAAIDDAGFDKLVPRLDQLAGAIERCQPVSTD